MNRLYETEIQVDSIKQVNAAILSVLEGREPQFENMVQFFTENRPQNLGRQGISI